MTLSVIGLRSVRWTTVGVANIGYFEDFAASQRGLSGLLNGPLHLSVTVGLIAYGERVSAHMSGGHFLGPPWRTSEDTPSTQPGENKGKKKQLSAAAAEAVRVCPSRG